MSVHHHLPAWLMFIFVILFVPVWLSTVISDRVTVSLQKSVAVTACLMTVTHDIGAYFMISLLSSIHYCTKQYQVQNYRNVYL